jgi:hypothetical protein
MMRFEEEVADAPMPDSVAGSESEFLLRRRTHRMLMTRQVCSETDGRSAMKSRSGAVPGPRFQRGRLKRHTEIVG